jgi:hypothetical protein
MSPSSRGHRATSEQSTSKGFAPEQGKEQTIETR